MSKEVVQLSGKIADELVAIASKATLDNDLCNACWETSDQQRWELCHDSYPGSPGSADYPFDDVLYQTPDGNRWEKLIPPTAPILTDEECRQAIAENTPDRHDVMAQFMHRFAGMDWEIRLTPVIYPGGIEFWINGTEPSVHLSVRELANHLQLAGKQLAERAEKFQEDYFS